MSTEETTTPEPINYGRISLANGMLATLGGLVAISAGMGLEAWTIHPLFVPLSFVWCLVYALRVADAHVQKNSS